MQEEDFCPLATLRDKLFISDNRSHLLQIKKAIALQDICKNYKIIWGIHFDKNNVVDTITNFKPFAINISGGNEEQVGMKDFDEINDLLEVITIED